MRTSFVLGDMGLREPVEIRAHHYDKPDGKQAQEPNIGTEQLFPGHDILLVNLQV
jgi:hypothetical protein